jgi:spore coat-associated protein N
MGLSLKKTSTKILASASLVAAAAAVAGLGTYGAFTSSTSASASVAAGTVSITLGAAGNSLSIPAAGVLPGDRIERLVSLVNSGNQNLNAVTLTTNAAGSPSVLTTDAINGLQLTVDACSVPWTGTAAPYTCAGTLTPVLAKVPVVGSNLALSNLTSLTAGKTDNLRVSATLPATAGDAFQGQTSTVGFSFTATQRSETVK